jgi:hypothetical protein
MLLQGGTCAAVSTANTGGAPGIKVFLSMNSGMDLQEYSLRQPAVRYLQN